MSLFLPFCLSILSIYPFPDKQPCYKEYKAPRSYAPEGSPISYQFCKQYKSIPDNLHNTTTELYLSGNEFKDISANAFINLPLLQKLVLDFTPISILHENAFMGLTSIISISIDNTELKIIEDGAFPQLYSLKTLSLKYNSLLSLRSGIFDDLSGLESLFVDENSLQELMAGAFSGLSSLKLLSLQRNRLQSINQGMFTGLNMSLITLKLNENRLKLIGPSSFVELGQLEELFLDNNVLEVITEKTFYGLRELRKLSIRNNKLNLIQTFGFAGLPQISELHLTGNLLTEFPHSVFDSTDFAGANGHAFGAHDVGWIFWSGNNEDCNKTSCWMEIAVLEKWLETDSFGCGMSEETIGCNEGRIHIICAATSQFGVDGLAEIDQVLDQYLETLTIHFKTPYAKYIFSER